MALKFTVVQVFQPKDTDYHFFDLLVEEEESQMAFISRSWKLKDGKISPPGTKWKGKYITTFLCSGHFAKSIQDALKTANPDLEVESTGWVSAKWGKSGLTYVILDNNHALEVWAKYKGEPA